MSGKDITDPAEGSPEIRGGEKPSDWKGPLPPLPEKLPEPEPESPDDSAFQSPNTTWQR